MKRIEIRNIYMKEGDWQLIVGNAFYLHLNNSEYIRLISVFFNKLTLKEKKKVLLEYKQLTKK